MITGGFKLSLTASPSNPINQSQPIQTPTESVSEPVKNDISSKKQALLDLKDLFDAGILSQEEFDIEKTKILKG